MSFKSQTQLESLSRDEHIQLLDSTLHVGNHPESGDYFLMPVFDLFSGTHILGVQGSGKSSLMESLVMQDIFARRAVILIDPHGDSVDHIMNQLPYECMPDMIKKIHVIDLSDQHYTIGLNLLSSGTQSVDRVMHAFESFWPDMSQQLYLPLYLRMATLVLLANKGSTLIEMYRFVDEPNYRQLLLDAVQDQSVRQFWHGFENLSKDDKSNHLMPLKTRLGMLFIGRPLVRNILGSQSMLDIRKAIEDRDALLIKLPLKTMPQDAKVAGTLLIAAIHEAIFSYAKVPENQRPGFSLYVDEFQNFATEDFNEMFTEGRKFGARVIVANQYLNQLPDFLQHATKTARNKVCFQLTHDDAREMAHDFNTGESRLLPENIDRHPVEYLLKYSSDNKYINEFVKWYLLPLQYFKHSGKVEIHKSGPRLEHANYYLDGKEPPKDLIKVTDPTPYLNSLLYEVMKTGNPDLQIPSEIVWGFSNSGHSFFWTYRSSLNKGKYLRSDIRFPSDLVVDREGLKTWVRPPENGKEQLYHFIFHLRCLMAILAVYPLGKRTEISNSEIAKMLTHLPRRAAFVRSGEDVGVIYTEDALPDCEEEFVEARTLQIRVQAIQKYCHEINVANPQPLNPQPTKPQFKRFREVI